MQDLANQNRCNKLRPVEPAANNDSRAHGLGGTWLAQKGGGQKEAQMSTTKGIKSLLF